MIPTLRALQSWELTENGYVLRIGEVEIWLEELLFDQQWYLAVYKNLDLVAPKVVVNIGKK